MKQYYNSFIGKLLLYLAMVSLILYVDGQMPVFSNKECQRCLTDGDIVCRGRQNNSISFCCDPNRESSENCTAFDDGLNSLNYDVCSTELIEPSMRTFVCPYRKDICSANSRTVLDNVKGSNFTAFSATGGDFSNEAVCYYEIRTNPVLAFDPVYDWQIDVNITLLRGVFATIHNGTFANIARNATSVDFDVKRNFTYNSTVPVQNSIYLTFTADPTYQRQSSFLVEVGLRNFTREAEEEEEDDPEIPVFEKEVLPLSKELTWSERVIMLTFLLGIFCYFAKKKCMPDAFAVKDKVGRIGDSWPPKNEQGFSQITKVEGDESLPQLATYEQQLEQVYASGVKRPFGTRTHMNLAEDSPIALSHSRHESEDSADVPSETNAQVKMNVNREVLNFSDKRRKTFGGDDDASELVTLKLQKKQLEGKVASLKSVNQDMESEKKLYGKKISQLNSIISDLKTKNEDFKPQSSHETNENRMVIQDTQDPFNSNDKPTNASPMKNGPINGMMVPMNDVRGSSISENTANNFAKNNSIGPLADQEDERGFNKSGMLTKDPLASERKLI